MIRLTWTLAVFALVAVSAHFGYLHLAAAPAPALARVPEPAPARARATAPTELIWLQRELDLTPYQFTTIRTLHDKGGTRVRELRAQLEAERRNVHATGNPAACMVVEAQCKSYTVNFIRQTTTVLTPAQGQKYLGLVGPCLPPATRTEGVNVEQSPRR